MSYDTWLDKPDGRDGPADSEAADIIIAEWMLDVERVGYFLLRQWEEGIDMAPCILQAMNGRPNQLQAAFRAYSEDAALEQVLKNESNGLDP